MTSSTFYNDIEVRGVVKSLAGKSIGTVTEMSAAGTKNKGCAVLYLGSEAGYTAGMVYVSDGEEWVPQGKIVTVDSAVTDGSTNPVSGDAVYGAIDTAKSGLQSQITAVKTTADAAMPKSGGTFTGAVTFPNGVSATAEGYLKAKWLQTTSNVHLSSTPSDYAVLQGGWIYSRTKAEMQSDLDIPSVVQGSSLAVTWASDTSVSGYSYKGTIALSGVTANHVPVVTFDPATANSGKFCPVAESGTNAVYIWSTSNTATTVQSVVATLP